jgi:hypothetical protein
MASEKEYENLAENSDIKVQEVNEENLKEVNDKKSNKLNTEKVNVWLNLTVDGPYMNLKQGVNLLNFPLKQGCRIIQDISGYWIGTGQDTEELVNMMDEIIKSLLDEIKKKEKAKVERRESYAKRFIEKLRIGLRVGVVEEEKTIQN